MILTLATVDAYDAGTHTATITLLSAPTGALSAVACSEQIPAADLTAGTLCIVTISDTTPNVVLCTVAL